MKLVITLLAKESLRGIHDYYKREVSVKVADKIKSGISQKLRYLSDHPYSGQLEHTLLELGLEHRRIVEKNYKIILQNN